MNKNNVVDYYNNTTKTISNMIRYIAYGLVAFGYGVLTSESTIFSEIVQKYSPEIIWVMLLGVLTIVFEYLQYIFNLMEIKEALKREDAMYDDESTWYKGSNCFFKLKQVSAIIGTLLLIFIVAALLVK